MAEISKSSSQHHERIISQEAPQLVTVLKEMKEGLDNVTNKILSLTSKVKADNFPTLDGMSYLDAKYLLLINYCQSLVYYLLSKAKGLPIQGHPVVRSLVEIRLFLEKIRPIDKKLDYQIKKLTGITSATTEKPDLTEEEKREAQNALKFRPNPDLLLSKENSVLEDAAGVYKPPKFAPASMGEEKTSKQERNALRKENQILRQAKQSAYVKELMDDLEGRPEEVKESVGVESREMAKYVAQMEERDRQEEEAFNRAPLTKIEKKKMKHLKSRSGLLGLTESFNDEINTLLLDNGVTGQSASIDDARSGDRKYKKRKRKH